MEDESVADDKDSSILKSLKKSYAAWHDPAAVTKRKYYEENPLIKMIEDDFERSVVKTAKLAARQGLSSGRIIEYDRLASIGFIQQNIDSFKLLCQTHGLRLEPVYDPRHTQDVIDFEVSGWAE